MKKIRSKGYTLLSLFLVLTLGLTGCGKAGSQQEMGDASVAISSPVTSSAEFDLNFSARDLDVGFDEGTATQITLSDSGIEVAGSGAEAEGETVIITQEGTYVLSGSLPDGQIIVDAPDTDKIQLVLRGVSIHNEDHAALYIKEADKVFITLAADSQNTLSDGTEYVQRDEVNVDGVVYSKADLTINGGGSLNVIGSYKHGIVSKDDLVITGGKLSVTAQGQGLHGKDCVKIKDGIFALTTQGDAIQSDNTEDETRGFVYIAGGTFTIETQGDAFQAETLLQTDGGNFKIITGGGSDNASTDAMGNEQSSWGMWGRPQGNPEGINGTAPEAQDTNEEEATPSAKGFKAGTEIILNEGSFDIDSSDDALHSNGKLVITGGTYAISSGDDGLHADGDLTITGGILIIAKSYEGIEGNTITLTGGIIEITASDDGLNVAGGNDGSSFDRPGQNNFTKENTDQFLRISGGEIKINAYGDGLDSNGNLFIEGGTITVSGPVNNGNGTLDYDGTATISGGVLMGTGSSGMAQGFAEESGQYSLLHVLSTSVAAGSEVALTDADGKVILKWTADKEFASVQLSSPELIQGGTYTLTAGSLVETVTLSAVATSNGGMGNVRGGGQGGNPGGMKGEPPQPGENWNAPDKQR
ncbi:carbohydrate-binding domain-containing protein [Desulfitobacterium hafniense]|uniref:carbohydrate-binding domain-containing protein n=1 Tax=Desulfitobacterium hafniense TaxID=49338 RepID=UPI00036649AE|nr:carbohydrate-binding domain-containing protein [Desulfitobacterium hafniense]